MDDPTADGGSLTIATNDAGTGSITRGFLFADLRGYTKFLETHGASAAADVLVRYRDLVRGQVARHAGAEIRTEGDSFYVVFDAVSNAVQCGLEIVEQARAAFDRASQGADRRRDRDPCRRDGRDARWLRGCAGQHRRSPVRPGRAGEVLVSDTVRALTYTVLSVSFVPRGRKTLKGVTDPVAVYAVVPRTARPNPTRIGRLRGLPRAARIGAAVVAVIAVVGVAAFAAAALRRPAGLPAGEWKIGLDMPLTGSSAFRGTSIENAVTLALDDANAAGVGGVQLSLAAKDDAGTVPNGQDPVAGAANVTALAADPSVVAMVGPASSQVAKAEIPITNEAGLLECSPANTDPGLTKPRDGALDLRSAFPTRINFIRTAPSDDIQGPALASFVFHDLGAKSTLVIDDADQGRQIADEFSAAYTKLGGTVVRRALNPGDKP